MVRIADISDDRFHGSRELSQRAMQYIGENLRNMDDSITPEAALQKVSTLCNMVIQSQPSMVQIFNMGNNILLEVENHGTTNEIIFDSIAFLEKERFREAENIDLLSRHLKDVYFEGMKIIVHSHSSTVNNLLIKAANLGYIFSVLVTEGSPMKEGRLTATELACHGIPVTMICDSAAATEVSCADLVLLGADGITAQGVVNKTGSLAMALSAKHHSTPIYVLATRRKFSPLKAGKVPLQTQTPSEIWSSPPGGVSIKNMYYEFVPLDMVQILTERGVENCDSIMDTLESLPVSGLIMRPEDMRQ